MRYLLFLVLPLTLVSCGLFFGSSTSDNKGEFQNILGSDRGWYIKEQEIEVLLDAKIGALRIRHVKMNNNICISGEIHHIEMDGPIGPDSSEAMKKLLENIPKCMDSEGLRYATTVYMNSGGGLLEDGYEMGRLFRKMGVKGRITSGQRCASSCAIAFLGSNFRAMSFDAEILFHAPYTKIFNRLHVTVGSQIKVGVLPCHSYCVPTG